VFSVLAACKLRAESMPLCTIDDKATIQGNDSTLEPRHQNDSRNDHNEHGTAYIPCILF
jgi:hypothetical protein